MPSCEPLESISESAQVSAAFCAWAASSREQEFVTKARRPQDCLALTLGSLPEMLRVETEAGQELAG